MRTREMLGAIGFDIELIQEGTTAQELISNEQYNILHSHSAILESIQGFGSWAQEDQAKLHDTYPECTAYKDLLLARFY